MALPLISGSLEGKVRNLRATDLGKDALDDRSSEYRVSGTVRSAAINHM